MDDGCRVRASKYSGIKAPTKVIINKKFLNKWRNNPLENPLANMYNNTSQYSAQGYQNYPQYQQNYNYGYEGYNQNQYIAQNVQPVPPGEEYPQNNWAPVGGYHGSTASVASNFDNKNEDEAVAQERKAQNAQLIKQRDDYVRKARVLRRELELLRNQKHEIMSENSSQRDLDLILKENVKLQEEIQSKMKAIHNVIEMLSSIIKDGKKISDLEAQLDESPKVHHKTVKSGGEHTGDSGVKYNYMHYDPELHWCRMCDEFPKTAKDFLLHLQCEKHRSNIQENDVGDNTPWHKLAPETELPTYEGAQKKRIPIRGLQFFIAAPAWYCKLCDTWIGDLHCASHHLKSQAHFQNYANFVEQNSHWEIEWLKDREKAMARSERHDRSSDSDEHSKKKKHRSKRAVADVNTKDKKKKKRSKKRRKHSSDTSSSSSSSDSSSDEEESNDKSKSIRVVMRNMKVQSIMNEDLTGKWEMLERLVDEHKKKEELQKTKDVQKGKDKETDDTLINQWMTVSEPQEKEKVLLDNLKDRMKHKQEIERAKHAEAERRQREKDREERELQERKQREEQEAKERADRERRERERQEYERIRDKDRNQVKFKTRDRENYRKRRTPSPSPERNHKEDRHYSRQDSSNGRDRKSSHSSRDNNGRDNESHRSRSRSRSRSSERKKPPGPPSKRLPFIGRMPLFKNKKMEDKPEKEIKKEDYDIPRQTRFQPGNLARAFLPQPDVVCFPKLSCFPPISAPPPPVVSQPDPPEPPKITEDAPKVPPAPKIGDSSQSSPNKEKVAEGNMEGYGDPNQMMDPSMMGYYSGMEYMYGSMYDYQQCEEQPPQPPPPDDIPLSHTMPLQPPPLPPNDPSEDLAMLGISADDMAAQSF